MLISGPTTRAHTPEGVSPTMMKGKNLKPMAPPYTPKAKKAVKKTRKGMRRG